MDKKRNERMGEPSNRGTDKASDKGYKNIFKNKDMFLEFLQTFVKEEWVNNIDGSDMILIDKEFILQDYKNKEADVVYRLKLKDQCTGEKNEVIFYILLELQSSVDRLMPYRLLMYMVEIWKEILKNVKYSEAQRKNFRLPSIVPIVLYNQKRKWTVPLNFKDILNSSELFEEHIVNFEYILVDINSYNEEELLRIANAISMIVMLDQSIVAEDKNEFEKRMKIISETKDKILPEKLTIIFEWINKVVIEKLPKEIQKEAKEIMDGIKEGEDMTYAMEKLFDNVRKEGKVEGKIEGKIEGKVEMATEMILDGEPVEKIMKYSKLSEKEVIELKDKIRKSSVN